MTQEEYDDIYRETLLCLSENISVGTPFVVGVDGTSKRMCNIDDVALDDDETLARWWGEEIRDDIRRQYQNGKSTRF